MMWAGFVRRRVVYWPHDVKLVIPQRDELKNELTTYLTWRMVGPYEGNFIHKGLENRTCL
jgi:hypothetical protein